MVNLDTTSYANMHVFGLWEEMGVPGENPHRHTENIQTYTERPQTVFGLKKTGRHFLLKLSVSQIFILHKKPQTNATFVITG